MDIGKDKFQHFYFWGTGSAILMLLFFMGGVDYYVSVGVTAVGMMVVGFLKELTDDTGFSWPDIYADALGTLTGILALSIFF